MTPSKSRLDDTFKALLARREHQGRLRRLTLRESSMVDFSSNGYLSLSTNPNIKTAYISHLQSSSDEFSLGSCGSRLLDGNIPPAENLESQIAQWHGAPAGLLFNSGFEANTGLLSCAPQPGDYVVYDELIHASVHDGMKLGRARAIPFAHNRVEDRPGEQEASGPKPLDAVLRALLRGQDGHKVRSGQINVFVAVEGVYSMDGDAAPLEQIVECVEKHLARGNGHIIVDEAHSTGWMGERGRGLVCQLGLEERVWARVHTFGKAMGCAGGEFFLFFSGSSDVMAVEIFFDTFSSYCSLYAGYPVLLDQLRTQPDIHHGNGIPHAHCYPNRLRLFGERTSRRPLGQPDVSHAGDSHSSAFRLSET